MDEQLNTFEALHNEQLTASGIEHMLSKTFFFESL